MGKDRKMSTVLGSYGCDPSVDLDGLGLPGSMIVVRIDTKLADWLGSRQWGPQLNEAGPLRYPPAALSRFSPPDSKLARPAPFGA
jgi:hypothetical protein